VGESTSRYGPIPVGVPGLEGHPTPALSAGRTPSSRRRVEPGRAPVAEVGAELRSFGPELRKVALGELRASLGQTLLEGEPASPGPVELTAHDPACASASVSGVGARCLVCGLGVRELEAGLTAERSPPAAVRRQVQAAAGPAARATKEAPATPAAHPPRSQLPSPLPATESEAACISKPERSRVLPPKRKMSRISRGLGPATVAMSRNCATAS
jgi:hypothetical protein